jgi:subtilase family serine protease
MRFRYIAATVPPALAAATLAVLPVSAGTVASGHFIASRAVLSHSAADRMTPDVSSPLAYKYIGKASHAASGAGYLFSCQQPGSSPNCYTPQELATAYDIPSYLTGAGQTIVIIDAFGDPTISQDLAVEDSTFGLPSANLNIIYPDGRPTFDPANGDEVSWSGEIALDVESAHAVAPAATIDLVIAKSDSDPDISDALKYAVLHHLGNVLSQSFGEAESCEAADIRIADHLLFTVAAAEGTSVFASSADDGAAQPTCDATSMFKSVALPAADPMVTGVGATSLTASQPNGDYKSETAWNDEYGASGGGYSQLFPTPWYQFGATHGSGRGVPDVSYGGDVNNGLLIAWSQGVAANVGELYVFGGTSAGSPQWAGITALADEAANHSIGFLNPWLYAIADSPLYNYVFHDVTTGNNTVSFVDASGSTETITGYPATPRWDAVTGLGTPNVAHLIQVLASPSFEAKIKIKIKDRDRDTGRA